MKKSLIALILVAALVVTVTVFAVSAETPDIDFTAGGTVTGPCAHCGLDNVEWKPFDQATLTTGHYYLADASLTDDTVSGLGKIYDVGDSMMVIAAGNNVCLHLNGNTLYRSEGNPFQVKGSLAVMDHKANEGQLRGRPWPTATYGGVLSAIEGGNLYIYGGTISPVLDENRGSAIRGGTIYVMDGYLKIAGGVISGGVVKSYTDSKGTTTAARGGNVFLSGKWKFDMTGGTISDGYSQTAGGNVFLDTRNKAWTETDICIANISGGTITGGMAETSGGNFQLNQDSELNLTNCLVTAGTCNSTDTAVTALNGGGNIAHSSGAHTTVGAGAVVSDGYSEGAGGNFLQVYGGSAFKRGFIKVVDGGQVRGGTAVVGGSIASGNNNNVIVENGGIITGGTASGNGGNIWAINAGDINVNADGTVTGGKATAGQGGNIFSANASVTINVDGGTVTAGNAKHGGNIMNTAGKCYVKSGTVSAGKSTAYGGNIYNNEGGKLYIQGGTITGGTAAEGGNVYQNASASATTMTAGLVTLGNTTGNGGNINIKQSSGTFEFQGGTVSNGTSAALGGNFYSGWGTTLKMSGNAKFEGGTGTLGGSIFVTGTCLNITGGQILNGTATTGTGGNLCIKGSSYGSVTNTLISGGKAATAGGNVSIETQNANQTDAKRAAGITLGTGTKLTKGECPRFGGNLYFSDMNAIVTLNGAELDGTGCVAGWGGLNIGIWNNNLLTITGDTVIKNGGLNNSVYLGDCDDDDTSDTNLFNLKVVLDGNADVDYIYFSGYPSDGYELCGLTIKEGFAGSVKMGWQADNLKADGSLKRIDFQKAGIAVPPHITTEAGYANAANIYVLDNTQSQKPVAYYDADADGIKELATTGMVAVSEDADGKSVETAITELPTDGSFAYIKLYAQNMNIVLNQDLTVDHNNMATHFVTGNYKLSVLNYRNDDGKLNEHDLGFTVDNAANLNKVGANPISGKQYVAVDDGEGKYSAHHIKIDIDAVSIKPATADMYYNVLFVTNAKAAAAVKNYGVVLSLADMPGADFATDNNEEGECENLYTEIEVASTEALNINATSALLTGILDKNAPEGQNAAWGEKPIFANAYVTLVIGGEEVKVMADNPVEYSLKDIMEMVDANEELAANASVIKMYKTWSDPLAAWGLDNIAKNADA